MSDRDRNRNYFVPSNAGSIHHRDQIALLVGQPPPNKVSFVGKCVQTIVQHWQILLLSLLLVVSACAESVFRKSVSTTMYNYRWFAVMLINALSFMLYLFILLSRKLQAMFTAYNQKKKKQERQKQSKSKPDQANEVNNDSQSTLSIVSSATSTELFSNLSAATTTAAHYDGNKQQHNNKKTRGGKSQYLHWRCYLIISVLDSLHMLFMFIPMAVLPATIVYSVPLIGMAIFALFNCCISCDNTYIRLGYDNVIGCVMLVSCVFLFIFQEHSTANLLTQNTLNYDKKYISNLIIYFAGCVVLIFNEIYKRVSFSKTKIDLIEYNLIHSLLCIVFLWLLSPLAYQLQYLSKYHNESAHITNITLSLRNMQHGMQCLFGMDTYTATTGTAVYDTCSQSGLLFVLLLLFMSINRVSMRQLLQTQSYLKFVVNQNSFIQHLHSVSIILAISISYLAVTQNLWNKPTENSGMFVVHLSMDWETPILILLLLIGSILSFRKIDEKRVSIKLLEDQWIIN